MSKDDESKSLDMSGNRFYTKEAYILVGTGRHCYTNGSVTLTPSKEMGIVAATQ
jgi:hypothetical protein